MPGRMMGRPIEPIDGANVSEVLSMSTSVNGRPKSENMNITGSGRCVRYDAAPPLVIPERKTLLPVNGGVGRETSQTERRRTT